MPCWRRSPTVRSSSTSATGSCPRRRSLTSNGCWRASEGRRHERRPCHPAGAGGTTPGGDRGRVHLRLAGAALSLDPVAAHRGGDLLGGRGPLPPPPFHLPIGQRERFPPRGEPQSPV